MIKIFGMRTQKELVRHLAIVMAKRSYPDRETFGGAVEEYLGENSTLRVQADRLVKWTTPGTWTKFLDRCWASYREFHAALNYQPGEKS